jgi:hypothetical protein
MQMICSKGFIPEALRWEKSLLRITTTTFEPLPPFIHFLFLSFFKKKISMATINNLTAIEFVVKPKEDLYLNGKLRQLPRVMRGWFNILSVICISSLIFSFWFS